MRIGDRQIGPDHPPYIIAEIGVNHDGDVARALELVDHAAEAGADAVKFQFFRAELLLSKAARLAAYQRAAGEIDPVEMLARLELSVGDLNRVIDRAHERGVHAIVTVFSLELVDQAAGMGWDAFKSASPDIVNRPLLEAIAVCDRPLIVSSGAATRDEVATSLAWLEHARDRLVLMQCVSAYPTPEHLASTAAIGDLIELARLPVGYSDHTQSVDTGAAAVRCGAALLEKHLTDSQDASGPDHAASLEPSMMRRYIELARQAFEQRPDAPGRPAASRERKQLLDIERDVRDASRQSLVATRDLTAGHLLRREDITVKRPGTGIPAHWLDDAIGAVLTEDVSVDDLLPRSLLGALAPATV